MDIRILNPTKARVSNYLDKDYKKLQKALTYRNSGTQFLLKRHNDNAWFKRQNPELWLERKQELQSQIKTELIFHDDDGPWIRPGSLPHLPNIYCLIDSQVYYPDFLVYPWKHPVEFDLYHYQSEAVENLKQIKHGHISAATGTGKSLILLQLVREMGLECVVVTPSKSIFNELLATFTHHLGKRLVGGYGDGKKCIKKKVTIAIGKSLTMLKPDSEAYHFFRNKSALLVDEAHTWGADTLEEVCHGVMSQSPYRFFVSATQTRNDGSIPLLNSIIGEKVLDLSIKDAINQGFLCPLKFYVKTVSSYSKSKPKDPMKYKRNHFLYNDEIARFYAKVANASAKVHNESTLILVEEVRQIGIIQKYLDVPFTYVHSSGKDAIEKYGVYPVKLQEEVDKFNNGEVKVLIGTKTISTGTNIFPTHNTCNWQGGASEIVTKQGTMGRSTRKLEICKYADLHKPKPYCKIWDVQVEGHDLLNRQLAKRISYYRETGEDINYV